MTQESQPQKPGWFELVDGDAHVPEIGQAVAHHRQGAVAEQVDLHQAHRLGAVLLPGQGRQAGAVDAFGRRMQRFKPWLKMPHSKWAMWWWRPLVAHFPKRFKP